MFEPSDVNLTKSLWLELVMAAGRDDPENEPIRGDEYDPPSYTLTGSYLPSV